MSRVGSRKGIGRRRFRLSAVRSNYVSAATHRIWSPFATPSTCEGHMLNIFLEKKSAGIMSLPFVSDTRFTPSVFEALCTPFSQAIPLQKMKLLNHAVVRYHKIRFLSDTHGS